jgi:hypothetical protein
MLADLREYRIAAGGLAPPGATDLRLHRVLIACGKDGVGLELRGGK